MSLQCDSQVLHITWNYHCNQSNNWSEIFFHLDVLLFLPVKLCHGRSLFHTCKCLSTNKYKYKLVPCTTYCGSCSQAGAHKHDPALHFACSSTLQWSSTHSMYYVGSSSSYDASKQLKNIFFEVYKSPMKCKEFEIVTEIIQSTGMRHHNHTVCVNLHGSPSQGMWQSRDIQRAQREYKKCNLLCERIKFYF